MGTVAWYLFWGNTVEKLHFYFRFKNSRLIEKCLEFSSEGVGNFSTLTSDASTSLDEQI